MNWAGQRKPSIRKGLKFPGFIPRSSLGNAPLEASISKLLRKITNGIWRRIIRQRKEAPEVATGVNFATGGLDEEDYYGKVSECMSH